LKTQKEERSVGLSGSSSFPFLKQDIAHIDHSGTDDRGNEQAHEIPVGYDDRKPDDHVDHKDPAQAPYEHARLPWRCHALADMRKGCGMFPGM
jgi:hypothetical protein